MGYIKEPKGVDLIIEPSVLTEQDKKIISEIIANYKRTGKMPVTQKRKIISVSSTQQLRKKRVEA